MINFIITSSVCLSIFLAAYYLLLEKEKMHNFNRFYLLGSIIISFAIPFLTFEIIKIVPAVQHFDTIVDEPFIIPSTETYIEEKTVYMPNVLWSLYGIISMLLLVRFGKNIWKLISKARSNPSVNYQSAKLVLIEERILPHTFLNSIFINFDDYNKSSIEDELYAHELVHVTQKHTLDILFIEILKVIFWFNPLFYYYKKAIQLNHEFLADEAIVKTYNNVLFYQNLLLQKSNNVQTIYLASNLNYLVTKKRLLMMTKNTSRKMALLKKVAIIPILAGLIYFFCIEVVAQEKTIEKATTAVEVSGIELSDSTIDDKKRDKYYSGVRIILIDNRYDLEINKMYEDLTLEEKRRYLNWIPKSISEKELPAALFEKMKTQNMAVWINEKVSSKEEIKKYKRTDFNYYTYSFVHKNARSKRFPQEYQYALYTKKYFDKNLKNSHLKFKGDTLKMRISNFDRVQKNKEKKENDKENIAFQDTTKVYTSIDLTEKPSFNGGFEAFYKYIGSSYKVPEQVTKNKLKGRVFVQFIIEKDGSLSNIKTLRDMGYGTGDEAIRVLKESPKWTPGKVKEKPVRTMYSLPISIQ
ncbi:M56 family metallopeptidase [Flavobacterium sp. j3]|uniref:M56 family metallopeptidase n=1 Tax=Flavobacterium aureirubrum TaxID=3133147 RepID=A0ABU9N4G7_9FLAO